MIDGQPIGDQVGITFSNSLNPAIAQGIEIVTGGVPAEYGEKAYGVINLTTRSALGQNGFHGDACGRRRQLLDLRRVSVAAGLAAASAPALFLDLDGSTSDRFLDPVTFDNFHNHGDTLRGFLRYDLLPAPGPGLVPPHRQRRPHRSATSPTCRRRRLAGQDERVHSRDWNLNAGYLHVSRRRLRRRGPGLRARQPAAARSPRRRHAGASRRRTAARQPGASTRRCRRHLGANELKVGVQGKRFPIAEHFSFLITDPTLNDPDRGRLQSQPRALRPARAAARRSSSTASRTGTYAAGYAQDTVRWRNLTVNAGVRYDHNNLFLTESLVQPRLGVAYYIPATKTVLRASYDRMFITPEYENILLSSSAAGVRARAAGGAAVGARSASASCSTVSERHNAYNAGIQQGIGTVSARSTSPTGSARSSNAADQDQFFNTGIVFPLNFKGGDLSGWNVRLDGGAVERLARLPVARPRARASTTRRSSAACSSTPARSTVSPQGPFLIDHDQKLQEQLGVFWDMPNSGFWAGRHPALRLRPGDRRRHAGGRPRRRPRHRLRRALHPLQLEPRSASSRAPSGTSRSARGSSSTGCRSRCSSTCSTPSTSRGSTTSSPPSAAPTSSRRARSPAASVTAFDLVAGGGDKPGPASLPEVGSWLAALLALTALAALPAAAAGPPRIAVSIAPAAYFVERIAGARMPVEVMVPPGVEEETYAPSPRQLADLLLARLYVAVGHPAFPLETRSLLPLLGSHPEIRVVAMSRGVALIPMGDTPAAGQATDPHFWNAPGPAAIAARNIAGGLVAVDPGRRAAYLAGLAALERDLRALDAAFRRVAAGPRPVGFISYHPAWGYLAHEYGFRQLPVEAGGKEPGAASLVALAAAARRDGVRLVLVPAGLPARLTATLASSIGGKVLAVDYMARDWLATMWRLAGALAEVAAHG